MSAASLLDWATHTGLSVTLLVIFVLIIRRPFTRVFGAGAAYSLWSLPFIRLFLPELNITVPFLKASPPAEVSLGVYSFSSVGIPPSETYVPPPAPTLSLPWLEMALAFWITGIILWLGFHMVQHVRFKRDLIETSTRLPGALTSLSYRTRRQLGLNREIDIRLSRTNTGPLVVGCLKPLVILPREFLSDYSSTQQYFALSHELAHIKRGDLWVALAGLVFRAINWPNPLIHYAARKFRADQEAACDAYVLARLGGTAKVREGYAETLIHAAKRALPSYPTPLGLTIYHPLKERLMTLKTSNTTAPGLMARILAGSCLATALMVTAPLNLAAADDQKMAGEATTQMKTKFKGKQVIKSVEDVNGKRVEKHYEILTENGQEKAYKISKDGTRTSVPMSEVKAMQTEIGVPPTPPTPGMGNDVEVIVMQDGNGEDKKVVKKRIRVSGDVHSVHPGENEKVIIKKMKSGQHDGDTKVYAFSSDQDVHIDMDMNGEGYAYGTHGSHSKIMVDVAAEMLSNVKDDEMSDKTKRKLEKARKALKEAQEAIEAEAK